MEAHRPIEALWHFRAKQDLKPHDPRPLFEGARALAQAGFPADTLERREAIGKANLSPDQRRARAEILLGTARPAEAIAALAGAAASAADLRLLGDARFALGEMSGAQAAYRRAIALEPDDAAGYDHLGRLLLATGEGTAAKQAFESARQREPGKPGHSYRLGLAMAEAGDGAAAEKLWQAVAAAAPDYAPARLALGRRYQRQKQWDRAAAHLVVAVRAAPDSEEAQLALAEVMTAQGDRASAFYQRGFSDLETDRPHMALAEFRRSMAAAPERVDGPLMVSFGYIQMQRLDMAAAEAQRGLERHPADPRLLARLAQLHMISHNRPLARRVCEEWLKLQPNAAEPYALLARIAREEQRLPESLRFGEQALAREPENLEACLQMSKTLGALPGPENRRRALDLARQAIARNPREADYWHQLGVLLRAAGQPDGAADAFLRALDLNPASVESCTLLVQIAAQEGRAATSQFFAGLVTALEARNRSSDALWRAVYRDPGDAAAHARLARFLLTTGSLKRARNQLRQVVALRPTDTAARRDLAVVERLLSLQES